MKTIKTLFIVFILPVSVSYAQKADSVQVLQPGAQALQFQITDDFNLSSFSGTLISYKRQISDRVATRIGVSFNGFIRGKNFTNQTNETDALGMGFNLGLSYTWMHYLNPDAVITFYYGYGPGVNIGYQKRDTEFNDRSVMLKETRLGIAGLAYAGVEWFFHESMSIHAEYSASVRFNYIRRERESINGFEPVASTKSISLGGDGVRFGISVYF